MSSSPIGVFDSGVGGLTVLKEILKELPHENTIYLGDTARVPYGSRSMETIVRYAFESMKFLKKHDIKMLVIACNTASAISLEALKARSPIPIIGVIEPGARAAVNASKSKRIGVIGTEATIRSRSYIKALKETDKTTHIVSVHCPMFVPLVEEGWTEGEIADLAVKKYLGAFEGKEIDTLLLGCTHYPLLAPAISKFLGPNIRLVDSAVETAKETAMILKKHKIENTSKKKPERRFFVTDGIDKFQFVGERFLGQQISNIRMVMID